MIQQRGAFVSMLLSVGAVLFLIPTGSVEARTTMNSGPLAKRLFAARQMPSGPELAMFQPDAVQSPQDESLPEGKGRELTQQKCNMCHASSVWVKKHYTEDKWTAVMDQMVEKGMTATDEEIATMTSYLTTNFGPKKDVPPPPQ